MKNHLNVKVTGLLALIISIGASTSGHAQTLLEQLQAANYDPTTGVWTATVGSNATATGDASNTTPTLATGATPNGSSAVDFNGTSDVLSLTTPVPTETSYTAIVFALATKTTSSSFFGGGSGAFQYRLTSDHQDVVQQGQVDAGAGTSSVSSTAFNLFDVTTGSTGTAYRLNQASDGTSNSVSFSSSISVIGSNQTGTGGELFGGEIAEIDIYSGVLTSTQIQAQEGILEAEYATTAAPEPGTWAMLLGGFALLLGVQRLHRKHGV